MSETVKTSSGREFVLPMLEEDAAIMVAAMSDPDARPFTNEELALARAIRRGGRPRVAAPKKSTCIRLSPEVAEAFRATGKGWQTRMNAALADWLTTHSPMDT
jgi:uncharacterized protein (DUF4415 family)